MSALDVITKAIQYRHEKSSDADVAAHAVTMLEAAGYVILSPDEVSQIAELKAELDLLQDILDSRPAINAALPDSYIRWSQAIYSGEAIRSLKGGRDAQ